MSDLQDGLYRLTRDHRPMLVDGRKKYDWRTKHLSKGVASIYRLGSFPSESLSIGNGRLASVSSLLANLEPADETISQWMMRTHHGFVLGPGVLDRLALAGRITLADVQEIVRQMDEEPS